MSTVPNRVNTRMRREMRRLRAEGVTLLDLALEFDVSHTSAHYHTHDIPPPSHGWKPGGRPRTLNDARIAGLRAHGLTLTAIADRYGVTPAAIHYALRRASLRSQSKSPE